MLVLQFLGMLSGQYWLLQPVSLCWAQGRGQKEIAVLLLRRRLLQPWIFLGASTAWVIDTWYLLWILVLIIYSLTTFSCFAISSSKKQRRQVNCEHIYVHSCSHYCNYSHGCFRLLDVQASAHGLFQWGSCISSLKLCLVTSTATTSIFSW